MCRSVPYDFLHVADEEELALATANLYEGNESLRETFGMTGIRLIRLVESVKNILKAKTPLEKPTPAKIGDYLRTKIKWASQLRVPSDHTVNDLLTIGGMLAKSKVADQLIQLAQLRWGRDSALDHYSKLLVLAQKASSGPDFDFLLGGLYADMVRSGDKDPYGKAELIAKTGCIASWAFLRRLSQWLKRQFHCASSDLVQQTLIDRAMSMMESPFEWALQVGEQDFGWTSGLPKPLALAFSLIRAAFGKQYAKQLKGMLANPPMGGVTPQGFLACDGLKVKHEELEKALKVFRGEPAEVEEGKDSTTKQKEEAKARVQLEQSEDMDSLTKLKEDARARGEERMQSCIWLLPEGGKTLTAMIQACSTSSLQGKMLAFFDPKNSRRVRPYKGQNIFQRAQALAVDPRAPSELWQDHQHCTGQLCMMCPR